MNPKDGMNPNDDIHEDDADVVAMRQGASDSEIQIAYVEELVRLGIMRKRTRRGQDEYRLLPPDDYVCPQCGGRWAGIVGRACENCARLIRLIPGA